MVSIITRFHTLSNSEKETLDPDTSRIISTTIERLDKEAGRLIIDAFERFILHLYSKNGEHGSPETDDLIESFLINIYLQYNALCNEPYNLVDLKINIENQPIILLEILLRINLQKAVYEPYINLITNTQALFIINQLTYSLLDRDNDNRVIMSRYVNTSVRNDILLIFKESCYTDKQNIFIYESESSKLQIHFNNLSLTQNQFTFTFTRNNLSRTYNCFVKTDTTLRCYIRFSKDIITLYWMTNGDPLTPISISISLDELSLLSLELDYINKCTLYSPLIERDLNTLLSNTSCL